MADIKVSAAPVPNIKRALNEADTVRYVARRTVPLPLAPTTNQGWLTKLLTFDFSATRSWSCGDCVMQSQPGKDGLLDEAEMKAARAMLTPHELRLLDRAILRAAAGREIVMIDDLSRELDSFER